MDPHLEKIKKKQLDHLNKLKRLANEGMWEHIQTHTSHPHSGFDWWMFPINRSSNAYGTEYQVSPHDVKELKKDPEFMKNYREGVILVAKSWGWDLERSMDITSEKQKWTGYQVRLGKMLDSLRLFDQQDLLKPLIYFIEQKQLPPELAPWIQRLLVE